MISNLARSSSMQKSHRIFSFPVSTRLVFFLALIIVGLGLRAASFRWNNRIQGDINLFALAAREFVLHDRLYYPMKYEFSRNFEYLTLANPATQHLPLWPFLAGVAGKIAGTDNTFFILKVMSECAGLALLAAVYLWGRRHQQDLKASALVLLLLAISPTVVDFSANGSSFVLLALFLFLSSWLLYAFSFEKVFGYFAAAVISAVGYQAHGVLMYLGTMFVLFGLISFRKLRWKGVAVFVFTWVILLIPLVAWNYSHFQRPFYSSAITSLYGTFGIPKAKHIGDSITVSWSANMAEIPHYVKTYAGNAAKSLMSLLYFGFKEIGPFALVLSALGCFSIRNKDRRLLIALLIPLIAYLIVVCGWAIFNYRFLVPVLPIIYLLAAFGFAELASKESAAGRGAGWLLVLGLLIYLVVGYTEYPRTRYYPKDMRHAFLYSRMVPIAKELEEQPDGAVLGLAASLDGGIEAIYWHRQPFVFARWLRYDEKAIKKLAADFDIRYIWADYATVDLAQTYFPESRPIIANESFTVLDLSLAH